MTKIWLVLGAFIWVGVTVFGFYKWGTESALREEAIAGYEKVVEHWQEDADRLKSLNVELAMYRDSLGAMRKRISNNDLRLIAKEKPQSFIGIINSNTDELFAAIEASSR